MAKKVPKPHPNKWEPEQIEVADLWLDPENPRLAEREFRLSEQAAILNALWRERAVSEVVDSIIAAQEYWQHEIVFAAEERGKLVVVEGNRRLAAVKVLIDPELRRDAKIQLPQATPSRLTVKLKTLPVIRCSRKEVWEYIGFKHVNGPQDWDSIAKAQYVARVHNEYKVPLSKIANTIGDHHDTVVRMYRGLMVLEQAERAGVFHRSDRYKRRFAYSHLWTALGYKEFQRFIGVTSQKLDKPDPVPQSKLKLLGESLRWMYGSRDRGEEPKIKSQNPDLRQLIEVIADPKGAGVAALRAGLPLEVAFKATKGDAYLLSVALAGAQQALREAKGLVATGYEGEPELLERSETIHELASSLYDEMCRMRGTRETRGRQG